MAKSRTLRHLRAIGTGMKHLFSNRLTCPYPDARQMVNERYRGMIRLLKDKCTSCMLCARACPANAIKMHVVDGKKLPGLDHARCVFCGFCVDICPPKALEHTTLHDVAYLDYKENWFPPEKFVDGGRDPYHVPRGAVAVRIDERKGLFYVRKAEELKILNNWLVLGIVLLIVTGASSLMGWTGLALTVLITGCIFFLMGLYAAWFAIRGAKKLGKE